MGGNKYLVSGKGCGDLGPMSPITIAQSLRRQTQVVLKQMIIIKLRLIEIDHLRIALPWMTGSRS
jgi:hypothetical protein